MIYGDGVGVFPKSAIDTVKRAGACELKVLLCLAAEANADEKKLSKLTGCTQDELREAFSFWRGAGVIEPVDGSRPADNNNNPDNAENLLDETQKEEQPLKKKLQRNEELPNYTSSELSDILEKREDAATLINECQNIIGKVFNVREINILMGFVDYLCLDFEYIMMLLSYCVSIGKKTLHYAEKTAFALYDAGICDTSALEAELKRRENSAAAEGKIRALFGIGDRAFTTKEKKFISMWVNEMGYPIEIITKAYEITADATGKGSFPYTNSVLERWNAAGLRTLEAIEESYKKPAAPDDHHEGSFDTDSFFDAAVKRALGEN